MLSAFIRRFALAARRATWAAKGSVGGAAVGLALLALGLAQTLQSQNLLPDAQRLLQTARQRYGPAGGQQVQAWLDMLSRSQNLSEDEKIRTVNAFWNQSVISAEDMDVWRQVDYWATPLESLGRRQEDCEDYVIGKYFSLLALGVPTDRLRFIYVKARLGGSTSPIQIAHMVLGYYRTPDAMPLVLDNLISSIEPAGNRPDLAPVFSFNASGIYVQGKQTAPVERIGRWNDLLLRMKREGFRQGNR